MNRTWLFTAIAALCFCAAGCHDDGVIDNENLSEGDCGGKLCSADQKCENDVCVDIEKEEPDPQPVVDEDLCKKTENTCKDATTQVVCMKGKKPVEKTCTDGECDKGNCIAVSKTQCKVTENTCIDDDTLKVCEEGQEPIEQKCSESLIRGACRDNECVNLDPEIGSACDDETICPEGSYCDFSKYDTGNCVEYQKLGDICDILECSEDLTCDSGICKTPVSIGDACDDLTYCQGDKCENGICSHYSSLYGECSGANICPEGSICIDNACVPTKGGCQSNHDCVGDSYCCLDAEKCGSNLNVCVPYSSENSYDPACLFATKPGIFEAAVQCYWEPTYEPNSSSVFNTVVSGKIHNKLGIETPLLAFITGKYTSSPLVIRILNPENCEEVENIANTQATSTSNLALADFDGDGYMEIIVPSGGPKIYKWDEGQQKHVLSKSISIPSAPAYSIHDIDGDGVPEIVGANGTVARSNGTVLSSSSLSSNHSSPAVGDIDGDGVVELMNAMSVYRWSERVKFFV